MNKKILKKIRNEIVDANNFIRKAHQCDTIKLSKSLSRDATLWSESCLKIGRMEYCENLNAEVTENIDIILGIDFNAYEYVNKWYAAIEDYDFNTPTINERYMKFMQIIWKNAKKIGIGCSESSKQEFYLVLRYSPVNISDENLRENISPLTALNKYSFGFIDSSNIGQLMIKIHNEVREYHFAEKLSLCDEITKLAQAIASKEENSSKLISSRMNYGVNYWHGEYLPNALKICEDWYNTGKNHKYDTVKRIEESKSFCQMIWRETRVIGCAVDKIQDTYIVVVLYSLAGNIDRIFKENVKKPKNNKSFDFSQLKL